MGCMPQHGMQHPAKKKDPKYPPPAPGCLRIFVKSTGEWVDVLEEEHKVYYNIVSNYRKLEQYHKRCCCPRRLWWYCDTFCEDCKYHINNKTSLDKTNDETSLSLLDVLQAPVDSPEETLNNKQMLAEVLHLLRETDPEADKMIAIWTEDPNASDRSIARSLGRPQRTFCDQMRRFRERARKLLE